MWENQLAWMAAATFWDWFWHIVAAGLCVYFSVPQLCWPMISKVINWYKKKKGIIDTDEHDPQQTPEPKRS